MELQQWIASIDSKEEWVVIIVRDDLLCTLLMSNHGATTRYLDRKVSEHPFAGIHYKYLRVYCNENNLPSWILTHLLSLVTSYDSGFFPLDAG